MMLKVITWTLGGTALTIVALWTTMAFSQPLCTISCVGWIIPGEKEAQSSGQRRYPPPREERDGGSCWPCMHGCTEQERLCKCYNRCHVNPPTDK